MYVIPEYRISLSLCQFVFCGQSVHHILRHSWQCVGANVTWCIRAVQQIDLNLSSQNSVCSLNFRLQLGILHLVTIKQNKLKYNCYDCWDYIYYCMVLHGHLFLFYCTIVPHCDTVYIVRCKKHHRVYSRFV